jgi:hypothetical protein
MHIKSIRKADGGYYASVDLWHTDSYLIEYGEMVEVSNINFFVFYHRKAKEWRVRVPQVWRIADLEVGCVKKRDESRQQELEQLKSLLAPYEGVKYKDLPTEELKKSKLRLNKLMFGWNACEECPLSNSCTKKFMAARVYPKVHLSGDKSSMTWLLAMNVGAVVAKMQDGKYPLGYKQGNILGGCMYCAHAKFIKRDNDPDCIDPVYGMATRSPESYDEVERLDSTMDNRNSRDTREKKSYVRCSLTGNLVWNKDACSEYVWNMLLSRRTDWVPAASHAIAREHEVIGGSGKLQAIYIKEVK